MVNSLRRTFCLALVVTLCLVITGSYRSFRRVQAGRPVLIVGTDNAPPYYQQDAQGNIVGVAVDVLKRAATELDFDLKFVHLSGTPDLFLRSRQVDLWPLLTITDARKVEFHMSQPWLYNTLCLLSLSGKPVPGDGVFRLGVWPNPNNITHAKRFFPKAKLVYFPSREHVMSAVCKGEADAGFLEMRVLDSLLLARPAGCEVASLTRQAIPGAAFPLGIASIKSAARQADQLHTQITRLANTGELATIYEQWSNITANEANSIVAMNAAQQRTKLAYGALFLLFAGAIVCFWQFRRARKAFRMASREVGERKRAEEARRNADRTRTLVLEGAGEGICGLDAQGRTTFLNSTAARMLGLEHTQMNGHLFHELVHGPGLQACRGRDCPLAAFGGTLAGNCSDSGEFHRADGTSFPAEFICSPLIEEGVHTGSVVTFKDVSSRRQAEWLDGDRNVILEMLAENRGLTQIFRSIALMVERQAPGMFCVIMTLDGKHLELRAAPTLPVRLREALRSVEAKPGSLSCGTAAHLARPVIARDLLTDTSWLPAHAAVLSCGVRSCWSHPILSAAGDVLGTIAIYSAEVDAADTRGEMLSRVACRLARLAIEQTRLTEQLHHQANHDSLTGLPNRLLFENRLRQALAVTSHTTEACALFYIDLDRFKQINDTLSHHVGDLYLCQVAKRLEQALPADAMLARLGGDEFAVLIPFVQGPLEAEHRASALLTAMAQPFLLDGYTLFGTASVGIGLSTPACTAAGLQSCADQAMYKAKSLGRNRFQFYSADMSRRALAQLEIEHSLRDALEMNRFELYYQPQCRANGDLVGFEALIRLHHPERGLIPPNEFIPVAEDTGLIVPIGSWVLREACRQLSIWHHDLPLITIAINVSAAQLSNGAFADEVSAALREFDVPPAALEIELTESMVMSNFEECLAQMTRLRDLGVQLSIDDFGTGHSSLSYLHRLPVHTIKIDQSFVRAMDAEVSTRPLVEAIVAAARSLACNVIAEGVETEMQRHELARMGCDHMQGYFFSRPLPAAEALAKGQVFTLAHKLALAS